MLIPNATLGRLAGSLLPVAALTVLAGAQAQPLEAPQTSLTLAEALRLARTRNGDVRAASLDARAAEQSVIQSRSVFFPSITPSYRYTSRRQEFEGTGFSDTDDGTSRVTASWRLLDAGERIYSYRSSELSARASRSSALQTLRTILFSVHQQYYDTLRAQELVRVAESQTRRARTVMDQTNAKVQAGETARVQILQAQADLANAVVQELTARNRLSTSSAALKALIGWDSLQPLPALDIVSGPAAMPELPPMESMVQQGLSQRADVRAQRDRTRSQRFSALRAERESQISFGVDAEFDQQLSPESLESRTLSLSVSLPWLDGGRSRAAARQAQLGYQASRSQLVQFERDVRSEIEAAYAVVRQNVERAQAAQTAVEAARQNYTAAVDSQRLGAADIVDVITAQTSLVTAESNFVEAIYDYQISEVRLRLVTGQAIPGEQA